MNSLSWDQVNAWRLSQHFLLERADRLKMLDVVSRVCAIQAQVMSAAELQIWARVDSLTTADVRDALWRERTLIKTWALRGTLHLLRVSDFPMFTATFDHVSMGYYRRKSWLTYFDVTLDEMNGLFDGIRDILTDTGLTREQLAETVAERTGIPKWREHLLSGWGSLLKPAAHRGYLCFGPNQGQNVTFVQPARWIGEWAPIDGQEASQEIARRFLTAYGPATIDELSRWFGMSLSAAKRLFRSLKDEVEEVEVDGWKAWMLAASLEQMKTLGGPDSVRLLPLFDPYTMAVARHFQYLMPEKLKERVYRPQGWISAVVLVNGRIAGVWEYEKARSKLAVKVEMFSSPTKAIKRGIEAEAERLGVFMDTEIQLIYEPMKGKKS